MENEKKSGGDKYSKLAGNTLIFAISSFSSKLLTLIVQPFLTYAMAEISDLGLSKILSQYANLLIPFVSMGMSNAIIRFGLDKGNSEKQVFTNGLLTILGGFGILVLCWPIARFLPDMAQYGLLIYLYVLMSCLRTLCTQFVRSRQWNKLVAVDGVLCTVATMAFYVLYLVGFKWGANGYLLAIISGDLVSVLFLMVKRLFCTVFFVLMMSLFLIQLFFDLLELGGQFFGADADLQNIVRGSENQSSSYIIKIFIVADNQKFTVHTAVFGCADQINPVHDRHLQITDDEIRMHALSHFQSLLSIGGRSADMETKRTPVQHGAKCNFYNRFVIDDQYLVHKFLPLLR